MTPEEVRNLIGRGETINVEFKGERSGPLKDRDLVEAVVCLANRQGHDWGYLFVGVEDDGSSGDSSSGSSPVREGRESASLSSFS